MSDYDWTIEITPTARAAISREIKAQWDGRELGGALVGHTDGERIVVTNANGIGIGVETPARRDLAAPGARAHSCAGLLFAAGVPIPKIAAILRHASSRVTLALYAGLVESQGVELRDDLEAAFR